MSSVARGVALFLGLFTILNLLGDLRFGGAGANLWWIDFWPLPLWLSRVLLLVVAVALIARFRPVLILTLAFALLNAIRYYWLLSRGVIHTALPIPLSLPVAAAIAFIILTPKRPTSRWIVALSFAGSVLLFPIAQISLFGLTDYRRPADLVVVFGARADANGRPSDTLADRVRTAATLYRDGLARRVLMSGGPGEGAYSEPEVMRRYARTLGVPDSAISLDEQGLNTEATVRNTPHVRVLAVSDFYHLPRIKMTYQRYGLEVFTVPARTTVPGSMPFNIAREDAAFWAYYLRRLRPYNGGTSTGPRVP